MLGDLRILDAGDELLLDTERVALQELFNMIRRFSIGYDVELHKRTLRARAAVAVWARGRGRRSAARARSPRQSTRMRSFRSAGSSARAIRTDVGVDLLCDAADSEALLAARDRRRARCRCPRRWRSACASSTAGRATASTSTTRVIPQEAGLNERAVSFTKGCYVGQETVARLYYRGKPNRQLRGLRLSAAAVTGR